MADNLRGVQSLYRMLDSISTEMKSTPFCKTVTLGTLDEIDLAKMTIFPMAHIVLNSVTNNENSLTFNMTIYNLDIVDISKDTDDDQKDNPKSYLYGNDNMIYIYTNQLYVINRMLSRLRQSNYFEAGWQLEGNPESQFVDKEMENMLAGYMTSVSISVPNDISKC